MLVTWPLLVVSGIGVVVGTIWAAFALTFWKVLAIAVLAHLVWGGICWYLLGWIRANGAENLVHALGVPLVFALRLASSIAALLLFVGLWYGPGR